MEDIKIIKSFGILYRTFLNYISKSLSISSRGLSFSDSIFLVNIGEKEGIGQDEIANSLAINKAAIARSVKIMEKKGYISTKKSEIDKRAKKLYLTETGIELCQYIHKLQREWLKQVLGDLTSDEIQYFADTIFNISQRAIKFKK